jgi:tetratricopeptide (TPR) repeat protein/predicted aspartyl protease
VRTLPILAALVAGTTGFPAAAETKCSVGQMLELPITMMGLRPTAPARINGHEVRFLVDSGAFYSSISPGSAAELQLRLTQAPGNLRVRGIGGEARMSVARVKDFGLGAETLHNIEFLVGGSEMGSIGLLGQNVLGIGDTEYDLNGGAIRLMKSKDCRNTNLAYWATGKNLAVSTLDIEAPTPLTSHTIGTVLLNGVKIRAVFDTGAPTTILTRAAAARAGIKPDMPDVVEAGSVGGLGRRLSESWIGPFQSLKIGDEEIRKIRLRFAEMGDLSADMLIGADFFLSHRVYVSNAQKRMFFTYNGGPVFDLSVKRAEALAAAQEKQAPAGEAGGSAPVTAQDFFQRANARAARSDNKGALADLNRAVELAPDNAEYRFQRALASLMTGKPVEARADLDRALNLKPDYTEALLLRASVRLRTGDASGARADLATLDRLLPDASNQRLTVGAYYQDLEDPAASIPQYDRWIAAHPDDNRLPTALNSRCWARALLGRDLDKAISDCDRALRLRPKTAAYLDSRGLARLRNGDLDKALADYNAALALEPKMAWSLYGRGLVEHRKGMTAQAKADIDAAVALQKNLPDRAKKIGLDTSQ